MRICNRMYLVFANDTNLVDNYTNSVVMFSARLNVARNMIFPIIRCMKCCFTPASKQLYYRQETVNTRFALNDKSIENEKDNT